MPQCQRPRSGISLGADACTIRTATGRGKGPVAAFGNSDGDPQMLQYTCLPPGPDFRAFVHHTDGAREWAYDRDSSVGKLGKGLVAAATYQWTLIDMAKDWSTIFAQ